MCKFDRIRVDAQNANASARALNSNTTAGNVFTRCWFKATSTATETALASALSEFYGCTFVGGGNGLSASGSFVAVVCSFNDNGGDGIRVTGAVSTSVIACTFYSCGSDGIELATLPSTATFHTISSCIFSECGGYGINNSTGASTNILHRAHNAFWSNTSGNENGFGDSPSFSDVTLAADPFTNAAGGDLSIVSGSLAKAAGIPGLFENQSYTSYLDIGAVQRQESGAAASGGHIIGC